MTDISRNAPCYCGTRIKYKKCCLSKDEAQRKPQTGKDAILVLMPTRGQVCHETLTAIERNIRDIEHGVIRVARKPVAEARNLLAAKFLETVENNPFPFTPRQTYALWVDDDCWFQPGLIQTMVRCMNEFTNIDALFGWFGPRTPFGTPTVWTRAKDPTSYPQPGITCKPGELVDIAGGGLHCTLMRASLLKAVGPNPFTPHDDQEGEDFAFCRRAKALGARLVVGTALPAPHVDPRDGTGYLPGMPAFRIENNSMRAITLDHLGVSGEIKSTDERAYGLAVEKTLAGESTGR